MSKRINRDPSRLIGVAALATASVAMAFAGSPARAADNPIEIGQLTSLTGKNSVQGVDMKRSAQLAVDRINNGYDVPMKNGKSVHLGPGLLNGRKLKLDVADAESRPKSAMDATRKLVNVDNVPVVIGTYSSGLTVPTGQFTNSNGVIQIGVGSTSPKLADIGPYYFNAIGTDRVMGKKLAEFAVEDSGAKTFTSIAPNNPFGVGLQNNACPRAKQLGAPCVTKSLYESEKSDYRPIIRSTFRKNPEAGFFTAYGTEARLILKQMYELGKKPPKGWYADYPTMWSNETSDIPQVADGIKGLKPGPSGGKFYETQFAKPYKQQYGEAPTTAFGAYAYDAAMMVALAIHKAGSTDPDKLKQALHDVSKDYKGVTGDKTFDDNGMQVDETYNRVIDKNGKLVPYKGKSSD